MILQDLFTIGFLIILEGMLSFDNALALAAMVKPLPVELQKRALTYGIAGAFVFRFLSLSVISFLMQSVWIKVVGGLYLIFLAGKYFAGDDDGDQVKTVSQKFWKAIVMVELTDIMFSMDSILASVAVSPKFWVVFTGGVLGIITMRFAAGMFVGLMTKFPKLETSAYLLVLLVGMKMIIQVMPHADTINYDDPKSPAFWIFWSAMVASMVYGFISSARDKSHSKGTSSS